MDSSTARNETSVRRDSSTVRNETNVTRDSSLARNGLNVRRNELLNVFTDSSVDAREQPPSVSLVDKYANFIRTESREEDATSKIAEDFCVSLEEQERIMKEIQAQKPAAPGSLKSSPGPKTSPPETKCR